MPQRVPLDNPHAPPTWTRRSKRLCYWLLGALALLAIISLLAPRIARPREFSNRRTCCRDLSAIGCAIWQYVNDNGHHYPSNFADVMRYGPAELFLCPSTCDIKPAGDIRQQADALLAGGHCSYVYVGAKLTAPAAANQVLAFELPDNHSREGGHVLYADVDAGWDSARWESFQTLVQLVPELESAHNPPVIRPLTAAQARTMYDQKWLPKLLSIKNGTWAASLPAPATQPSAGPN
jgi:hypothetical protein